jgi:hypothetical protein
MLANLLLVLSTTPYKEGWLRRTRRHVVKLNEDLSTTPYKEGWLRRQLKIDGAPKGFEACRSRT